MRFFTDRLACFVTLAFFFLAVEAALAQKGGPPPAGPSAPSTGSPTTRSPMGSIPSNPFPGSTTSSTTPIILTGRVMFDDGTPPNPNIRIERVCGGATVRFEAHTDTKGRFSLQLGQNNNLDLDAADSASGGIFNSGGNSNSSASSRLNPNNPTSTQLMGCELRASYPGYRSDVVELSMWKPLDNPNVGTIVLHHLTNVVGSTLSVTTALAPKHAQKEYEKGLALEAKGDFASAEKHLLDATEVYPKYAVAWCALGETQQKQGKNDAARKSFEASIAADNKLVTPYGDLSMLAVQAGNWQEAAEDTARVIQLNPIEFPAAFWFNAFANYKLNKPGDAERSLKQLLQLDTAHKYPQGERLFAQILYEKGNYSEAETHLNAYLALRPGVAQEREARELLAKLEQANAEAHK